MKTRKRITPKTQLFGGCPDTQHNDIQYDDTQLNDYSIKPLSVIVNKMKIQNNNTQHNAENCYAVCRFGTVSFMQSVIVLNVVAPLGDLRTTLQNFFVSNLRISKVT